MRRGLTIAALLAPLGGCYEHVVRTSGDDPSMPRQTYDANVDDTQPGFFDRLFWGDPPAGQDPVEYYRLKRAGKDIPPSRIPPRTPLPPEVPAAAPNAGSTP